MPTSLTREQRNLLSRITLEARDAAETAACAALENLAVHESEPRAHMTPDQRLLRNRLRARGRALGDRRDPASGAQGIGRLTESVAYEHWHRLLFTRFLAENHLLHTDAANGDVPVTLEECEELAPELSARDGFELACRFASETLPGIFRPDDPALALRLAPNHEVQLRKLLDSLPADLFRADDALGWTYQFWQARRKDEVNKSGVKIGADELPAVTQLFTEDYMVEFLLHNSLGAWWAGRVASGEGLVASDRLSLARCPTESDARRAVALPAKDGLPGIDWTYLRFVQPTEGNEDPTETTTAPEDNPLTTHHSPLSTACWQPAAGTFEGWPKTAAAIRFLDPCMGSGHFLVFALPILARLRMEEEGLDTARAVAAVLRDNLHGLELDERCTQIAAFNLALTAWKLGGWQVLPPLHLACSGLAPHAVEKDWVALAGDNDKLQRGMERLYRLFKDAPVLGSLINPRTAGDLIDADFHELQPLLAEALKAEKVRDDEGREMGVVAEGLAKAAEILAGRFTLAATNVPYLAGDKQSTILCKTCESAFPLSKRNLGYVLMERMIASLTPIGTIATVGPQNWLFQPAYPELRKHFLRALDWNIVARLGTKSFQTPMWDLNVMLFVGSKKKATPDSIIRSINVEANRSAEGKAASLPSLSISVSSQLEQLKNPNHIVLEELRDQNDLTLGNVASSAQGLVTGDDNKFVRRFWETTIVAGDWQWLHLPPRETALRAGRVAIIWWAGGKGDLHNRSTAHNFPPPSLLGRPGVAVQRMNLNATLYDGDIFGDHVAPLIPNDQNLVLPLWCFCESPTFTKELRRVDSALKAAVGSFLKIPFNLAHWQKVAAEKYPQGLPKPYSNDPTQWLFNGHPKGSEQPLHVAVARLLGYRWPRQTGSEFPDCPALGPDGLEEHSDPDGIVCLQPLNREQPAAARLRTLLAAALSGGVSPPNPGQDAPAPTEAALLAATGAKSKTLEDWLRDEFFEQHCKLFHQRPFVWHIWDGRKDGFHALVNYHQLDHATLQKLTYSYLGDWLRQQDADAKADKPGAAERLGAARALETELENILKGEPPYDLFIRWKPLSEQPLGWNPDLNDSVRLNIRPFLYARDVGKKGAGILRAKPNIKWDKDRGKEPLRDPADYPWFWHDAEPPTDCEAGRKFTGHHWNDVHFTLARKKAARDNGD